MKRIRKREGGDDISHLSSPPHPPPQPSIIQHTSRSNSQYHPLLLYTESPTSVSTLCLFPLPSSPSPSSSPLPRYDPRDERPSCEMSKFIHVLFFFLFSFKNSNFFRHTQIFWRLEVTYIIFFFLSRFPPELSPLIFFIMHMQDLTFPFAGAQSQTDGYLQKDTVRFYS